MVTPPADGTITRIVAQLPAGKEPEPFPTLRRIAEFLLPRKRLRLTWLYDKDIARSNGAIAFPIPPTIAHKRNRFYFDRVRRSLLRDQF